MVCLLPVRSIAANCLLALGFLAIAACGGSDSGGGGGDPPAPEPNVAPVLSAPSSLSGGPVAYTYELPVAIASGSLQFTAVDADGDLLLWQASTSQEGLTAAGLSFASPVSGNSFTIDFAAVSEPAATSVNVLVEDPRGGAAAIDVLVIRTGAPTLLSVTPSAAFATAPQQVALTGTALSLGGTQNPQVAFGGAQATQVTVLDNEQLTCASPATLSLGPVSIAATTSYGTGSLAGGSFTGYAYPIDLRPADTALDGGAGSELVVDSDGSSIQRLWLEGGDLQHSRSLDGGATWSATQVLSAGEVVTEPQVLVRGDDVLAVWIAAGTSLRARASDDGGVVFASVQGLSTGSGALPAVRPRLAATGTRRHVCWLSGASGVGARRVRVASSLNAGQSFGPERTVSDTGNNQSLQAIGCDEANVWVALFQNGGTGAGVYTSRSSDGGVLWTAARRRSSIEANVTAVETCSDGARAYLVWVRAGRLDYMVSTDAGASWPTIATLLRDSDLGTISDPAIACEGERLFAAYLTGAALDTVAFTRVGAAGASPESVTLSSATEASGAPQLAVRGNYAVCAWRGGPVAGGAGTARIRLASSVDVGATFLAPATFGDGASAQELPRLVFDDARVWLGWLDYRGVGAALFGNRSEQ
ncbi:MAG: IPT/TIG domain-containing protein [Planctomycetota bacterium]